MTAAEPTATYRLLPPDLPADTLEQQILAQWTAEDLLGETLRARAGADEFVFFEGPPTANGRPGIHHVLSRTIKDLFCRYRAMKGYHVLRKAGWDTHGLPVEIEVEKRLGISGKQQIEELGVEEFNRLSRESVWTYKSEWEKLSARIGYWLDYSDPYVTYSNDYVESVWWALSTLHGRGLLYRGHKILPYCPRCGTALSSHEVAQGYEDVRDPSVYVALELGEEGGGKRGKGRTRILVWTTTPWTLVSNVALAVHPDLVYLELERRDGSESNLMLAEARAGAVLGDDWPDRWRVVRRVAGRELAGQRYRRPLDWMPYATGEHEVIVAEDFVSAEDGSGVVHMAPAFGADDYAAGQRHGLAFLQPVNLRGEFPADMPLVGGMFVKKADPLIIEELRRRGVLWKAGTVEHAYPHCWRCGTPLLYYARESWFIRTTSFRDAMLARNARVDWHPSEVGQGRFGEWLENNIDWALSRDRYWGTPLPVWVCERDASHVVVIDSYAELARRLGTELPADFDPHKPYIDRYELRCERCTESAMMRRVPEVIDTWFDSGSMPFAQWHFPFAGRDIIERQYPADFIAEGVDQTRGWFYSLLAIATGLGDALPNNVSEGGTSGLAAPYRAVVVNDLVLDATGAKMSKSKGNVVNPWEVMSRHGADATRLYLVAASQVWLPRRFDDEGIRELAGRFLLTLKNVYSGMFAQYANFGWTPGSDDPPVSKRPPVDRWVLSRLASVCHQADELMWRYDATLALRAIMDFVDDDVSNWYVRVNRGRFYDVDSPDNRAAFATLHEVLVVTCRLLAPFAPFVTDWMHRELTAAGRDAGSTGTSVHLAPFGGCSLAEGDPALEQAMGHIRRLATLARAARKEAGVKIRQPLSRLLCVVPNYRAGVLDALVPLLRSELNVKGVEFALTGDALVRLEAKPNFRALGKRFGKKTPLAAQAVAALSSEALLGFTRGDSLVISVEGESHSLAHEDLEVVRRATGDLVVQEEGGYFAAIDPAVSEDLRREGIAREVVNRIQRMRKELRYVVSDRVRLQVTGNGGVEHAVQEYQEYVAGEVLASEVIIGGDVAATVDAVQTVEVMDDDVRIALTRVH
ncbi:MAG TPA: isoleucine--tRNA ligase [Gemmatimonadaceae bacterium]|nr:isoleucine--tRNA ligase [Gemmatimonadaceae bacterium]